MSCLELISSNVQSPTLDFSYLKKIYDDVENALRALTAASDNQLTLASLTSLLDLLNFHRNVLRVLHDHSYQTNRPGRCEVYGRDAERRFAVESMKMTFSASTSAGLDAVVGLEEAKNVLQEACLFPLCYPHLFQGSVRPWRRILLFGPPGTGKTLLAKGLAEELRNDFFCVSSSDLFSAWIGESEKMIKELFENARRNSENSLIFIDEIDSLCRQRTQAEDEHSRRVKTELLRQFEGLTSFGARYEPLILAATNCPWDIDPAFLRRFQRRIYVGLPNRKDRRDILERDFSAEALSLTLKDWEKIIDATEGFSGADLSHLINAAGMVRIRELHASKYWKLASDRKDESCEQKSLSVPTQMFVQILTPSLDKVCPRPVEFDDFLVALHSTPKTITPQLLKQYEDFKQRY